MVGGIRGRRERGWGLVHGFRVGWLFSQQDFKRKGSNYGFQMISMSQFLIHLYFV